MNYARLRQMIFVQSCAKSLIFDINTRVFVNTATCLPFVYVELLKDVDTFTE